MANEKYPIAKSDMKKGTQKAAPFNVEPKRGIITKCPTCKKDFATAVKAAYKLGLLDGRNQLQQTINCIRKTNRRLFDELLRLDKVQPLDSCCIKMSQKDVEELIKHLRKKNCYWYAKKLQKLLETQIRPVEVLEEVEE